MIDAKPEKRYRASAAEWTELRKQFVGESCWVCGERWTELHHIYPRGQGGDDVGPNLAPVCMTCHGRIEARDPESHSLIRQALMPSNLEYLRYKLGENTEGWLSRNYPLGTFTHNALDLDLGLDLGVAVSEGLV